MLPAPHLNRRRLLAATLAAGAAPAFLRRALAADRPRFELGVASGFPRPDGMVLWTKLTGDGLAERVEVRWELARDEGFRDIVARGSEPAEAAWGHSVHAEPAGLEPGRWYFYRFEALGTRSATGRTRTAPAADAAVPLSFAIASCQRYDHGRYAAWRQLAGEPLDLVLFLGDYIYEYPSSPLAPRQHEAGYTRTLADYRARYATYQRDPQLQAAHAAFPWLLVWDDHEVENDYAGLQGNRLQTDFAAQRAAAYQAYWEHLPFPRALRPRLDVPGAEMRIYGAHDWGRLARILTLDDRQYRDPQACPKPGNGGSNTVALKDCPTLADPRRTLLGETQERWLAQAWTADKPWNLLAQQTLMARFAWSDPAGADAGRYWTDGWDGYAPARQRLLAQVAERRLGGAVVLGGDVHTHYVADLKADFGDPRAATIATEFCGTSISSQGLEQARLDAARGFNPHIRYARADQRGYVGFTLGPKQLDARLMVVADAWDAASRVDIAARFTVEAGRPGAQAA
ncbi:alkaline phosphatase D family protein [Ideonella sp.]|uniref:alkaline phosphatase D family protein n=1 Tax=Ideonella sp. TaxID=1929293 RepID=UPI002B47C849|nr:alkaline phosphatase D family protein [Ideonella sp.]